MRRAVARDVTIRLKVVAEGVDERTRAEPRSSRRESINVQRKERLHDRERFIFLRNSSAGGNRCGDPARTSAGIPYAVASFSGLRTPCSQWIGVYEVFSPARIGLVLIIRIWHRWNILRILEYYRHRGLDLVSIRFRGGDFHPKTELPPTPQALPLSPLKFFPLGIEMHVSMSRGVTL